MRLSLARLAAPAALVATLITTSGCGLESNGLSDIGGEGDSGPNGDDFDATSSSQVDGTVNPGNDGSGNPGEDATLGGEDTGAPRDASHPEDSGPKDDDAGADAGHDAGFDAGEPDAGHDAGIDASVHDSGADAAPDSGIVDAGPDACGSVEICNNGKDDDCNGLIDCADPECGASEGWTCTNQTVPAGWTVVEYNAGAPGAASCGAGYATPTNVFEPGSGPYPTATCGCSCSVGTSGSCESGDFTVDYASPTSGGMCTAPSGALSASQCDAIPIPAGAPISSATKGSGDAVPYAPGTCTANGTVTKPAPLTVNGFECADPSAVGAGCANGGACVPKVTGGFKLCIAQAGAQTCPTGFTTSHTVGTSVTDTRGCTTCDCTGPTAQCNDAMITLYTDTTCSEDAGVATLALNGSCNSVVVTSGETSATAHAYQYSATLANEACGSGTSSPDGTVSLDGTTTICCQP